MLSEDMIKREAAKGTMYTRGCQYFREHAVRDLEFFPQDQTFEAKVRGSSTYMVWLQFDKQQRIHRYECDCPAYYNHDGACKHIVAVLKAVQQQWSAFFDDAKSYTVNKSTQAMLQYFSRQGELQSVLPHQQPVQLKAVYGFSLVAGVKKNWLECSIGTERLYIVKDIPQLLTALETGMDISYGKQFTLQPDFTTWEAEAEPILQLLQAIQADARQLAGGYHHSSDEVAFSDPRRCNLSQWALERFFQLMSDRPFPMLLNDRKVPSVRLVDGRPPLVLSLKAVEGGIQLAAELGDAELYALDARFRYIYHRAQIFRVDAAFSQAIKPLLACFSEARVPEVYIPNALVSDFFATALPAFEQIARVDMEPALAARFYQESLAMQVYFDRLGSGMAAHIHFRYGDIVINPLQAGSDGERNIGEQVLLRSKTEENRLLGIFRRHGFAVVDDRLIQPDELATYQFLQDGLPDVQDMAEVFYSEEFKAVRVQVPPRLSGGIRLSAESGMLELSLQYEEMNAAELWDLLQAYRLKQRYHRLPDGGFISLEAAEFQDTAALLDKLALSYDDIAAGQAALPKYRALYLDSAARAAAGFHLERSAAFRQMVQDIHEPQHGEFALPSGLNGKLRDYQKTGYKWLKTLAAYGLGGILADDMGLGKTLQTIAFLLDERQKGAGPSLVVAPTSLVYNWQEEMQRFAPSLCTVIVTGTPEERQALLQNVAAVDVMVTSYALLRRDIEIYEQIAFQYCFIDEAQHIKNPHTQNAKAVKRIRARGYFALTGTPIENTLTELWSIFDFLMPGYLMSHPEFLDRFEAPIVKDQDTAAMEELGRHIRPFILRRLKKTVLKELPPKIESKLSGEMTAEQHKVYAAWLLQAREQVANELAVNGLAKSQIKILSILTRLRQICCHPALFLDNYRGGSGKLDMLRELLSDAIEGGHRVLVFSQFTSMLQMIGAELKQQKINYHYLDGNTPPEQRLQLVHSFNSGDGEVFLISLKAGGTGLNLTGADMVIHYDPWWNPAVEDQATDRAYRLGQKRSVQVYKLIAKHTIEEKIYELQQRKKEMIDALIQPGETLLSKLSEDEIRSLFDL